jgi:hypothetical protein
VEAISDFTRVPAVPGPIAAGPVPSTTAPGGCRFEARMHWIKVASDLPTHRKSISLGVMLQDKKAWAYVVRLWMWAQGQAEDGRIVGHAAVHTVEHVTGWDGPKDLLVPALVSCGFLDDIGNGFRIHDWEKHAGAQTIENRKAAKRKRDWRKRRNGDGTGTSTGQGQDGTGMSSPKRKRERERKRETEKEQKPIGSVQPSIVPLLGRGVQGGNKE